MKIAATTFKMALTALSTRTKNVTNAKFENKFVLKSDKIVERKRDSFNNFKFQNNISENHSEGNLKK
jgi:hypothetical protein